jgi:hypothetical protein
MLGVFDDRGRGRQAPAGMANSISIRASEPAEAVTGCQPDIGSLFPSLVLWGQRDE